MSTRFEIYDEGDFGNIFHHLIKLEKQGQSLGNIDETGLFTCNMDLVPLEWKKINEMNIPYVTTKHTYVIQKSADILHSIRIYGRFKSATLFQYSFLDTKIIYDQVEGIADNIEENTVTIMMPFPESGIPLIQARKNFYLEIIPEDGESDEIPNCEVAYGYLDTKLRKKFNVRPNQTKGVSFLHKNSQRYAVFGVDAPGHSINVIGPEG
jgi:hypothetical protein